MVSLPTFLSPFCHRRHHHVISFCNPPPHHRHHHRCHSLIHDLITSSTSPAPLSRYLAIYQVGAFIARSSVNLVHVRKTWIFPIVQVSRHLRSGGSRPAVLFLFEHFCTAIVFKVVLCRRLNFNRP